MFYFVERHPANIVNRLVVLRAAYSLHASAGMLSLRHEVPSRTSAVGSGQRPNNGFGSPYECGCLEWRRISDEFRLEVQRLDFNIQFAQLGGVFVNLLAELLHIYDRHHLYLRTTVSVLTRRCRVEDAA